MVLRKLSVAAGAAVACVGVAAGQDRMPPLPPERQTEAQRQAVEEIVQGPRGAMVGPFFPMLRSPGLLRWVQRAGAYLRYESKLDGRLREMLILMAARHWTQQYEWNAHRDLALKAGLRPEIIAAIAEGRRPAAMAEDEEIAYNFSAELNTNRSVSDATYARAVQKFGEPLVVDMVGLNGYYSLVAMMMNVARTPLPPGARP